MNIIDCITESLHKLLITEEVQRGIMVSFPNTLLSSKALFNPSFRVT